jgi:hypothetical protein
MKSNPGYQSYTWKNIQTIGIGHDPSGHALWMEKRWGSQSTSHWCDNVAKKCDSCGVEKVVQTWVSSHLTWLHLGLRVQDVLLPHPPMELVPALQNIQQVEVVHSTTHLTVSLPRMCSISPLTRPYQWHLMGAQVAGTMMMTESIDWFRHICRNVAVPAASIITLVERSILVNLVSADHKHHSQGLARCRETYLDAKTQYYSYLPRYHTVM